MDRIAMLQAYVRLVDLETFTAVAEELRVKQSTISKWVAALEEELGTQLLDRTTRVVRVTELGRRFYDRAVAVLEAYEKALGEVQQPEEDLRGRIRMSVPVVFGQRFVVPLVSDFLVEHPHLELEMVFSDRYVRMVEEGFDLAVRVGLPVDSTLISHHLGVSRRKLVAAPEYLAARGTPSAPVELTSHECLLHAALSPGALWSFTRNGTTERCSIEGRIAVNNSEATLALARRGLGIALLASWLVDEDIRGGRLVPLLTDYETPKAPIRALTPPGRYLPPRVRTLIQHLRTAIGKAVPS